MAKETYEKCPLCGAWRLTKDLVNHIGVCQTYKKKQKGAENDYCCKNKEFPVVT